MSDNIKHECGVAFIRLRKPLQYYYDKYGTSFYALNKMYLLMEKQHNRGQDGAGLASIKLDTPPGYRFISRARSNSSTPLKDIFAKVNSKFIALKQSKPELLGKPEWLKENLPWSGEIFLGHLRYGTYGNSGIEYCHPFLRTNNWQTKNLILAGNFNLTNVDELFNQLVDLGQHPKEKADTVTIMERIGHFLDKENERLFALYKDQGLNNVEVSNKISENLDIVKILKESSKKWDGGYVMAGIIGNGDSFVIRDVNGIRPAYYYIDDEIVVVCSERPVIQTAMNVPFDSVKELNPGNALIVRKNNTINEVNINEPEVRTACSFERIYFSRGSDAEIYNERKQLGYQLCPSILPAINHNLKDTVFSYIPNTAEVSFYGLMKGLEDYINTVKKRKILEAGNQLTEEELERILNYRPRAEKIAIKDAKLRTFITDDANRSDMVAHVYDITYGTIKKGQDTLVIIDDSIVRGTTLKQSIIKMLDRLGPKKIIIVSSAPQIRYPDCYGIDMAKMGDFIAFQAAVELLKENNMGQLLQEVYHKAKLEITKPMEQIINVVKEIYKPFSTEQLSDKIAKLLTPQDTKAEICIVYQTIEGLHVACPNNKGDWYFTGNYPTPGGNKVVLQSYINYIEGKNNRAY
ncbi:MAG: amidophosphoribosyltransferase [Bacteroidia bacterium]|nr:amidophosphoribosyltransferase [Bacteroidia bacterium]MCZ2249456.1 amidophosphoribosyltransferase [Bacteroidia bacterium]